MLSSHYWKSNIVKIGGFLFLLIFVLVISWFFLRRPQMGNVNAEEGEPLIVDSTNSPYTISSPAQASYVIIKNGGTLVLNSTLSVTENVTIEPGGVLTHTAGNTASHELIVGGNLDIQAGGKINLDAKGYAGGIGNPGNGYGPGGGRGNDGYYGRSGSGGGYGGNGGIGFSGLGGGASYGSLTQPVDLGSGGGGTYNANALGGAGGGAIKLEVLGTLTANGSITANGAAGAVNGGSGSYYAGGGGSGGSIWITANVLAGSGTITANGGAGGNDSFNGGGGGGGRIAIHYTTGDPSTITKQAFSGSGGQYGGAGTIFTKSASANGDLVVDNNNHSGADTPQTADSILALDNFTLQNGAKYVIPSNTTLNIAAGFTATNASITNNGTISMDNSSITNSTFTNNGTITINTAPATLTIANSTFTNNGTINTISNLTIVNATFYQNGTIGGLTDLTIGSGATFEFQNLKPTTPLTLDNLTIQDGGKLTHKANSTTQDYTLNLVINNNLDIQAGGAINLDARGYSVNSGPGAGGSGSCSSTSYCGGGGAGYGGNGGRGSTWTEGSSYGSLTQPTDLGSGGGFYGSPSGGGAIKINIYGIATINGLITANGTNGGGACSGSYSSNYPRAGGGGSGGSVWIQTGTLLGSGTITANGGAGAMVSCSSTSSSASGGGGAGGRIAIHYITGDPSTVTKQASGGSGYRYGGAGTIYLVQFDNFIPSAPTLIEPADAASNQPTEPVLKVLAIDADNDYLRYKIILAEDPEFTVGVQTFDQTLSQAGWSGQNAADNTAYTSGAIATYTVQTALTSGTYYWKAFAIDPGDIGSNTWSEASKTRSFESVPDPDFDKNFGENGEGVKNIQIVDPANERYAQAQIDYAIRDIDTTQETIFPNYITPSFEYSLDGGVSWNPINPAYLSYAPAPVGGEVVDANTDGQIDHKVKEDEFLTYTAYWEAKAQIPGQESSNTQIRVTLDDHELVDNLTQATGPSFYLNTLDQSDITQADHIGTFTSPITENPYGFYGKISWNATVPLNTFLAVEVRAGNTAVAGPEWTDWQTVSNGQSLSFINHYLFYQYRINLGHRDEATMMPSVQDITIETYQNILVSSPYDSLNQENAVVNVSWRENPTLPENSQVVYYLRTAEDEVSLANADWRKIAQSSADALTAGCNKSSLTGQVECDGSVIPEVLKDGSGDQWMQSKIFLYAEDEPVTLAWVGLNYAIPDPYFNPDFGNQGVSASQITDLSNENLGQIQIDYSFNDVDTTRETIFPNYITPSFEYSLDGGVSWNPINPTYLAYAPAPVGGEVVDANTDGQIDHKVKENEFLTYTAYWEAKAQIPGQTTDKAQVRVTLDDKETASLTPSQASANFNLDTADPTVNAPCSIKAYPTPSTVTFNFSDTSPLEMRIGFQPDLADAVWEPYAASRQIDLPSDPATIYCQFRDQAGNSTEIQSVTTPETPTNLQIQDISEPETGEYRLFLSWKTAELANPAFDHYTVYRSIGDEEHYQEYATIGDRAINYYLDNGQGANLDPATTYYYKLVQVDSQNNVSFASVPVFGCPDGTANEGELSGEDTTAPEITNVEVINITPTTVTVVWHTNEPADSQVDYITQTGGDFFSSPFQGVATMVDNPTNLGRHEVTLIGLTPETDYYFQIRSTDATGNKAIYPSPDIAPNGLTFSTSGGPIITPGSVKVERIEDTEATIVWTTDLPSDSWVHYSTKPDLSNAQTAGQADSVTDHRVTLTGLTPNLTYYFYVSSGLSEDKNIKNGIVNYYTFQARMPTLVSFSSTTANGVYRSGAEITIVANYSEEINPTLSQTLVVTLNNGQTVTLDNYQAKQVSGVYTVGTDPSESVYRLNVAAISSQNICNASNQCQTGNRMPYQNIDNTSDIEIDNINPQVSWFTPPSGTTIRNLTDNSDLAYGLSEHLQSASLTFIHTGQAADADAPHTCVLTGDYLNAGDHLKFDTRNCQGMAETGIVLQPGAIYTIKLTGLDDAGNELSLEATNIAFSSLLSFSSPQPAGSYGVGQTINITAQYFEDISAGSLTVKLNNGVTLTLNQISANQISGVYTVGALGSGEDTDQLQVAAIQTEDITTVGGYSLKDSIVPNSNLPAGLRIDATLPRVTAFTPVANTTIDSVGDNSDLSYTLSEQILSGQITFTHTGGAPDDLSPHTCLLAGDYLKAGAHQLNTQDCQGREMPIDLKPGAVYTISFQFEDLANNQNSLEVQNIRFNGLLSFFSQSGANIYHPGETIDITAQYFEDINSGSLTVKLNNGKTITLDQISANQISGVYTVGALGSGEDTDQLQVVAIQTEDITTVGGSHLTNSILPADNLYGLKIDATAPTINLVSPVSNSLITNVTDQSGLTFSFSEELASAVLTIEQTSSAEGANDSASPHTCTLPAQSLSAGTHQRFDTSLCQEGAIALVSNVSYRFTLAGQDLAGNTATTQSDNVYFDSDPTINLVSPASNSLITNVTDQSGLTFFFSEELASAVLTIEQTGSAEGANDSASPHTCTLPAQSLSAGTHQRFNTSLCQEGAITLVNNVSYRFTLAGQDLAGNAASTQSDNVYFDSETIVLNSFSSTNPPGSYGPGQTINLTANYTRNPLPGAYLTVKLNNGKTIRLDQLSANQISGVYTVGALGSGEDIDQLQVTSILELNVCLDSNTCASSEMPADNLDGLKIDVTTPTINLVSPASNSLITNVTDQSGLTFSFSEELASAVLTIEQTGSAEGANDSASPHTCTLPAQSLSAGTHQRFDTSLCQEGAIALVNNVSYRFTLAGQDLAGNTASTQSDNVYFDSEAIILTSFSSTNPPGSYGPGQTINLTANYTRNPLPGAYLIVKLNNGKTIRLDQLSANQISGVYTVGALGSGEDVDQLQVTSILELNVCLDGNTCASSEMPADNLDGLRIDATAPTASFKPSSGSLLHSIVGGSGAVNPSDITYRLSENLSQATIVFQHTGGAEDEDAPHTCTIKSDYLVNGEQIVDTTTHCLEGRPSLKSGGEYRIIFSGQDPAGNTFSYQAENVTYSLLKSFHSTSQAQSYGPGQTINLVASYSQPVDTGSLTVTLNNGKEVVLDQALDYQVSGVYTVGALGSGEDANPLQIQSIKSENVYLSGYALITNSKLPTVNLSGIIVDTTAPEIIQAAEVDGKTNQATITWKTSEATNSIVEYGGSAGNYTQISTTNSGVYNSQNWVTLTNLEPNTTYYYRVKSEDRVGNQVTGEEKSFTTQEAATVSNLAVESVTESAAVITFQTSDPVYGSVIFGTTAGYYPQSSNYGDLTTEHRITIDNLLPNQEYFVKARIKDPYGYISDGYEEISFTTMSIDFTLDASFEPAKIKISFTGDQPAEMRFGLDEDQLANVDWQTFADQTEISLAADPETVYGQFRNSSGDSTRIYKVTVPASPSDLKLFDGSNLEVEPPEYRLFLFWQTISQPPAGFSHYTIYRKKGDGDFEELATINDIAINYYMDDTVTFGEVYEYKMTATDQKGNVSFFSNKVDSLETQLYPAELAEITEVTTVEVTSTTATITWNTSKLSHSRVDLITQTGGDFSDAYFQGTNLLRDNPSNHGEHKVVLSSLERNTTYYYQVKSKDLLDQTAVSKLEPNGYSFTTLNGPLISNVRVTEITQTGATIEWTTDIDSGSQVFYADNPKMEGMLEAGDKTEETRNHKVELSELKLDTVYYFWVKSDEEEDKNIKNGVAEYYTFTTLPVDTFSPEFTNLSPQTDISTLEGNLGYEVNETLSWMKILITSPQHEFTCTLTGDYLNQGAHQVATADCQEGSFLLVPGETYLFTFSGEDLAGNYGEATTDGINFLEEERETDIVYLGFKALPEKRRPSLESGYTSLGVLEVREVNTTDPVLTATVATDRGGTRAYFALPDLSPGNYDVAFKPFSCLRDKESNVTLALGENFIDFSHNEAVYFKVGDINNSIGDNVVNAMDISVTISNLGEADPLADLNKDEVVNSIDIAMVIANLYEEGEE